MAHHWERVIRAILREHRHLMTESERRADRAFRFLERAESTPDPAKRAEMSRAAEEALRDAETRVLFEKGRQRFLEDMAQRILAEHGPELPRCEACGEVLKQPSPKDCFDCNR